MHDFSKEGDEKDNKSNFATDYSRAPCLQSSLVLKIQLNSTLGEKLSP